MPSVGVRQYVGFQLLYRFLRKRLLMGIEDPPYWRRPEMRPRMSLAGSAPRRLGLAFLAPNRLTSHFSHRQVGSLIAVPFLTQPSSRHAATNTVRDRPEASVVSPRHAAA